MKDLPLFSLLISLLSALFFVFPEMVSLFIYDRQALLNGELWRLISSHTVHFGWIHLLYNLPLFIAAGWILEKKSSRQFIYLYLLNGIFISLVLLIAEPDMTLYGGLSGIVCGLIFYCALINKDDSQWRALCLSIIVGLPVKIAMEFYFKKSVLPFSGSQPFVLVPVSHLTGITVSCLYYTWCSKRSRFLFDFMV